METEERPRPSVAVTGLGSLERGSKPRIVAVVDSLIPLENLLRLKRSGIDLLEIRVDLIETNLACVVKYLVDLSKSVGLPLIGTVRENARTSSDRLRIFRTIMPHVQAVDIELGCAIADSVIAEAHRLGITVIVSEHDFETTPSDAALGAIVERARAGGADIVKIATMARSREDAERLLRFIKGCTVPVAAFAMGEQGAFSRVLAGEYGSLFTYGYISKAVAPGQLPAAELAEKIRNLTTGR
jgi:3-dehydroquinate dehydratase-1